MCPPVRQVNRGLAHIDEAAKEAGWSYGNCLVNSADIVLPARYTDAMRTCHVVLKKFKQIFREFQTECRFQLHWWLNALQFFKDFVFAPFSSCFL